MTNPQGSKVIKAIENFNEMSEYQRNEMAKKLFNLMCENEYALTKIGLMQMLSDLENDDRIDQETLVTYQLCYPYVKL